MERYWQIEKINLKYNVPPRLFVCMLVLALSPFLIDVSDLGPQDTAKALEMYVALLGIVLLVPISSPEPSTDIHDLVNVKYTDSAVVYLIRFFGNSIILAILLGCYIWELKNNHCDFPGALYFLGTYAEMLFLGGLGIFCYGLCNNLIVSYMIPIMYYIIALASGTKYLKLFYPFSMTTGSYHEKFVLFAAAIILSGAGIALQCKRKYRRK